MRGFDLYPPRYLKSYQLAANANPLSSFAIRNLARTLGTIGHRKSYEASDTPAVVVDEYNPGPVSIPEDEPYVLKRPKYIGVGGHVICLAPYNDRDAATTVEIKDAKDAYDVVVSYEVQSVTDEYSDAFYTMSMEARVWIVDEDGEVIKNLDLYRGTIDVTQEDGSWQHAVSGRCTFIGLEGVYNLKVVDYTEMHGYRGNPHRTYRNMRLRVTRR